MLDDIATIHSLWWELNKFLEENGVGDIRELGNDPDCLMERFRKDHPEIIRVHCDDSYHSNSFLYLIPHENDKEYMGCTVIYVPQMGRDINQFFLYPNDHRQMLRAMKQLEDKFQVKGRDMWKDIYGPLEDEDLDEDVEVSEGC